MSYARVTKTIYAHEEGGQPTAVFTTRDPSHEQFVVDQVQEHYDRDFDFTAMREAQRGCDPAPPDALLGEGGEPRLFVLKVVAVALFLSLAAPAMAADGGQQFTLDPRSHVAVDLAQAPQPAKTQPPSCEEDPWQSHCKLPDTKESKEQDDRAFYVAVGTGDRAWCMSAAHPEKCRESYDLTVGDYQIPNDPVLADQCSIVVRVDLRAKTAVIYSRRLGKWVRRALRPEWSPGSVMGHCEDHDALRLQRFLVEAITGDRPMHSKTGGAK